MWIWNHPFQRDTYLKSEHPYIAAHREQILSMRKHYEEQPLSELTFSSFRRYDTDGNRTAYENEYFDRRGRLTTMALCAWIWEKQEDIRALEDVLWAVCNEFTWALPAHLGGNSLSEDVNPLEIDLFAAETAQTLAEILSLLKDKLSVAVKNRCRNEIQRRVLQPFASRTQPYHWEQAHSNWCAVCAGSIGMAAIYLIEDEEELCTLLGQLVSVFSNYLDSFSNDGACLEGLSYWTYGMTYFTAFLELAEARLEIPFDFLSDEKIKQIAHFPQKCCLREGYTISFSDGSIQDKLSVGLACKLHEWYGSGVPGTTYAAYPKDDECHRWCRAVRDVAWTKPDWIGTQKESHSVFLPDAQWAVLYGKTSIRAAIKGGNNAEPHNHNDIGSFLVLKRGEELISDLGAGEYTKEYFSDRRYDMFCNGSQGHSVPIINGAYQCAGSGFRADAFEKGTENQIGLQFRHAYEGAADLVRRCIKMQGDMLFLEDTFAFEGGDNQIVERMITKQEPKVRDGKVELLKNGAVIGRIEALSLVDDICIRPLIHKTHQGESMQVYAVDFHIHMQRDGSFRALIG
jgi:hypothetical protein